MLKKIEDYINTRILLLRLEVSERIAKALATLYTKVVLLMLFGIFFFFASIAIGFYVGEELRSLPLGFGIVAAFYFILAIIFTAFHKSLLETPFMNRIIKVLFEQKEEDESSQD
jgi:hypothetical protein